MDSVSYSPEPARDARAARKEVAADLALLSAAPRTDATETSRRSTSSEAAAPAAPLPGSTPDGGRPGASAPAPRLSTRTGLWGFGGSAAPIERIPAPVLADGLDPQAPAGLEPGGIEGREPRWPEEPDPSHPGQEGDRASEAARPEPWRPSRSSEDPAAGRAFGVVPDERAPGLDPVRAFSSGDPAGSGPVAGDPLEARDRTDALARAGEAVNPLSLRHLAEAGLGDREVQQRFEREMRATSRLFHPNLVAILDAGFARIGEEAQAYYLMERIDGESLELRLRRAGPLPRAAGLRIAAAIARGLAVVHEEGLVHRDLKPSNVLLPRLGEAKLTDFGLSRWRPDPLDDDGEKGIVGSAHYLSPERLGSSPIPRAI
jgi:hypothetical protein